MKAIIFALLTTAVVVVYIVGMVTLSRHIVEQRHQQCAKVAHLVGSSSWTENNSVCTFIQNGQLQSVKVSN